MFSFATAVFPSHRDNMEAFDLANQPGYLYAVLYPV
jgi:hypothetical protein